MYTPNWIQDAIRRCLTEELLPTARNVAYAAIVLNCENIEQAAVFMYEHAEEFVTWQAQQEGGAQ